MNHSTGLAMSARAGKPLAGIRILVVEDDAVLAFDMMCCLENAGAEILGPAASLKAALAMSEADALSCGVFDVSLGDEFSFPAAQALKARGAGVVFHTGFYDLEQLRREWPDAEVLSKPAAAAQIISAVSAVCGANVRAPAPV